MRSKDGSDDDRPPGDWRGAARRNDTHESTLDPQPRLLRMSNAAPGQPGYPGHALIDNRQGLEVNVQTSASEGTAEPEVAARMPAELTTTGRRLTPGPGKAHDTRDFVKACRRIAVWPHAVQNVNRTGGSAIGGRTTQHIRYATSQRKRNCIEQWFGWGRLVGPIQQVMVQILDNVDQLLTLTAASYNLMRQRSLARLSPQRVETEVSS